MKIKLIFILTIFFTGTLIVKAQEDDLESLLEEDMGPVTEKVLGTFLSTYVLNNHSVELLNKNGINFRISHKFGFLNTGSDNFYGFDNSSVFTGIEYAPADWINVGIGRGTFRESFNTMVKIKLLEQQTGAKEIPVSIAVYSELDYRTKKYVIEDLQNDKSGRIEYTSQLLIARKFGKKLSAQLMPGYTHRNLVETREDINGIASVGVGASYSLLKRLRLNAEYYWVQEHDTPAAEYFSPLSAGICYQTSRHAFELFATNSTGITSNNHIAYTTGDFFGGDVCIGFNISIVFSVKR
ncbi:MAG: hypothetical protein JXA77_08365 [Bacteroidales bacterium]|nr:hypothetical protein [Bacteroidales bacterium]MBN2820944.1 hypothetical protein [Bacteroidales bacterium]